jgi:cation transport ATPase
LSRVDGAPAEHGMFLDLAKAISFFSCILALYHASIHTFFVPGARWEERLVMAAARLGFAACICFLAGFVFTWPGRSNPDRFLRVTATLPVRLFFWSAAGIVVLFLSSWYLADLAEQAGPFVSNRAL